MEEPQEEKAGIPAWVMTFADLMSLLMCFFVLLLSFAEMDAMKFKQIAASMEKAFGVQRKVPAVEPPMGTSPIFDKFSPGKPQPTMQESVKQETSQDDPKLRTFTADGATEQAIEQAVKQQMELTLQELQAALSEESGKGMLQIEQGPKRLIIRIEERGSFGSGSADLNPEFAGMVARVGESLALIPGEIAVEGHTDEIPISTLRFRSNWDLSAGRAAAVANALLSGPGVAPERVRVQGHAETRPRVANDSATNRALNRRVEIVVDLSGPVQSLEREARVLAGAGQLGDLNRLGWTPGSSGALAGSGGNR